MPIGPLEMPVELAPREAKSDRFLASGDSQASTAGSSLRKKPRSLRRGLIGDP